MNAIERLKQKPILVGGIIAGTLVSVGLLGWGISQLMPAKSQTATVKPAPQPPKQIVALGRLEPAGGVVKLSAPLALDGDRVKELRVEEGSTIRAGQIIAVLDSVDRLQATLIQERQQVAVAQAKLAQIKAGAKPGELVAQRATISRTQIQIEGEKNTQQKAIDRIKAQRDGDKATQIETIARIKAQWEGDRAAQSAAIGKFQVELANARSELNRYQQLAQQGAISQSLLDSKKLAVASFRQQLQEAEAIRTRIENTSSKQLNEAQEHAAFARRALHADAALHQVHQPAAQGQADAGAFDIGVRRVQALEGLEQAVLLGSAEAGATVSHLDAHAVPRLTAPGDLHLAAQAVVLDGVGQQVEQHLLEPDGVGQHVIGFAATVLDIERDAALCGRRAHQRQALGDYRGQVHRGQVQLQRAGLDAGDVEHIVDQAQQVAATAQQLLHAHQLRCAQRVGSVTLHQLREAEHCAKWARQSAVVMLLPSFNVN